MANFFIPQGQDPAVFEMTMDPKGSGSDRPFLHPWKLNLMAGQPARIGLALGADSNGKDLSVTSNAPQIAEDPYEIQGGSAAAGRIFEVAGRIPGVTMLEVRSQGNSQPWCVLQLQVTPKVGSTPGKISIMGPGDFTMQVNRHLQILRRSSSFRDMWDKIIATGYVAIIQPSNNTGTYPVNWHDQFVKDGAPGRGCNTVVYYDANNRGIGLDKGSEPWRTAGAPYISLGHELVHVWMDATGTTPTLETDRMGSKKERLVSGTGHGSDAPYSENKIRRELGLMDRPVY